MTFCKRVDFTQFCLSARHVFSIFFPFCVFCISPDIESCTLKEYLIIYSILTSHSHLLSECCTSFPCISSIIWIIWWWQGEGNLSSLISHCGHWRLWLGYRWKITQFTVCRVFHCHYYVVLLHTLSVINFPKNIFLILNETRNFSTKVRMNAWKLVCNSISFYLFKILTMISLTAQI